MTRIRIPVGLSGSLLDDPEQDDGGNKHVAGATKSAMPYLRFEPVSPEIALGGSVFRSSPTQRRTRESPIRLRMRQGAMQHVTQYASALSTEKIGQLRHLCGYILCATTSGDDRADVACGDSVPQKAPKKGMDLFIRALAQHMPWLPIGEERHLRRPEVWEHFIERVCALHELNQLWQHDLSRGALIAFHSRYKLLLLAHSQPQYRELGPFVARIDRWASLEEYVIEYRARLMTLLSTPPTRRNHTNVLMHVQGYFRRQLNTQQRQELAQHIDCYRRGLQPLSAPIALLRQYMAQYPDAYLAQQRYFSPYLETLRLCDGN
ncbi:YbgA family protein [Pectobacterium cacticida]|uniref:YbgA family protein n=1 Tax=Pectobacterium cacticida TaxID=69221 RepID=UPI002FF439B5